MNKFISWPSQEVVALIYVPAIHSEPILTKNHNHENLNLHLIYLFSDSPPTHLLHQGTTPVDRDQHGTITRKMVKGYHVPDAATGIKRS